MKHAKADLLGPIPSPAGFDEFWHLYPVKRGKQDAIRAWMKLKLEPADYPKIYAAVRAARLLPDWVQNIRMDTLQYIPRASTWLNGRQFEDEDVQPAARCNDARVSNSLNTNDESATRDWWVECQAAHQGTCNGSYNHRLRMQIDAAKAKR